MRYWCLKRTTQSRVNNLSRLSRQMSPKIKPKLLQVANSCNKTNYEANRTANDSRSGEAKTIQATIDRTHTYIHRHTITIAHTKPNKATHARTGAETHIKTLIDYNYQLSKSHTHTNTEGVERESWIIRRKKPRRLYKIVHFIWTFSYIIQATTHTHNAETQDWQYCTCELCQCWWTLELVCDCFVDRETCAHLSTCTITTRIESHGWIFVKNVPYTQSVSTMVH